MPVPRRRPTPEMRPPMRVPTPRRTLLPTPTPSRSGATVGHGADGDGNRVWGAELAHAGRVQLQLPVERAKQRPRPVRIKRPYLVLRDRVRQHPGVSRRQYRRAAGAPCDYDAGYCFECYYDNVFGGRGSSAARSVRLSRTVTTNRRHPEPTGRLGRFRDGPAAAPPIVKRQPRPIGWSFR
jgi:hypothetical protein